MSDADSRSVIPSRPVRRRGRSYIRNRDVAALLRGTAVLFLLGLSGLLALGALTGRSAPSPVSTGTAVLVAAALLFVAAVVGVLFAPRMGLRSHLLVRAADGTPVLPALRSELGAAVAAGIGVAVGATALDAVTALLWAGVGESTTGPLPGPAVPAGRLLYWAVTGELLLRWGAMTAVAWIAWGVAGGRGEFPDDGAMWVATLVAAVLFGVPALPTLAAGLVPALTLRSGLFSALGGVVFGWLYWRRSLEAAMVAHGTALACLVVLGALRAGA